MSKKVLYLLPLVFGASMMLSSCKDNLTDSGSIGNPDEEEALEKCSEKGEALLSILSMAAGLDSLSNDWYKNTYTEEPIVGTVKDASNPYVRYVAVNNAEEAYAAYKSMVSEDLTGSAKPDQWRMEGIGSLTFTINNQSDLIATVGVNVLQMPHLTEIRFVPASSMGDNSSLFTGDPYYQFGDIVQDTQEGTYWICARPASKAASKSTTHWISFNTVDGNFKEYEKAEYEKLTLPDDLGNKSKSEEHILNFLKYLKSIHDSQEGKAVSDLELSGVKLLAGDIVGIANSWKKESYTANKEIFPGAVSVNFSALFDTLDVNVFYNGHHSGKTPDVHMLTTNAQNFDLYKKEIKFEWPKGNKGTYNFKNYLDPNGNTADLANLTCKKTEYKMPQKALIIRYKTGYQLSGRHTIWGNDYEPGQSFHDYSEKMKDIFVLSEVGNIKRAYNMGDIASDGEKNEYLCVKSSSPFYFFGESDNIKAILIGSTIGKNAYLLSQNMAKIVMFHILNAYLLNENLIDVSDYPNYKQSLVDMWNFMKDKKNIKAAFDSRYGRTMFTLYNGESKYQLGYSEGEYYFQYQEDIESDQKLKIYVDPDNGKANYQITTNSKADINKSANEAAKMFKKVIINE